LIFIFGSCGTKPYYSEKIEINKLGWLLDDEITFNTQVTDTSAIYELQMIIDHQRDYSYENLYLRITTSFPNIEAKTEQLSIDLADKKGKWVGKCGSANCECQVYLLEKFRFPAVGEYKFQIEQFTREDKLLGLNSLELRLLKASTMNNEG